MGAVQVEHQLEHAAGGAAVEIAGRLVGEHARRPGDERARERGALPLAARELARACGRAARRAPPRAASRPPRRAPRRRHAADEERHRDVLERRELRQQVMELVDEPERAVAQAPALGVAERRSSAARAPPLRPPSARRARRADGAACSSPTPTRRRSPSARPARRRGRRRAAPAPAPAPRCRSSRARGRRRTRRRAAAAASLIAQRFGRLHARGAPARVDRRHERQHERHRRDHDHVGAVQLGRQLADVVDLLRQELDAEQCARSQGSTVSTLSARSDAADARRAACR